MNLWIIVIIVAVVAMVLGPIMMLQPNATQRKQEELRRRAMELGLRVKIVSLPKLNTDAETPAALPVYYLPDEASGKRMPRTGWLLIRMPYAHEAHFNGTWQWHGDGRASAAELAALNEIVAVLPPSVRAVEANVEGYGFYWSESGGVNRLETLVPLLHQLQAAGKAGTRG